MSTTLTLVLAQVEPIRIPSFFMPVFVSLLVGGAVCWLVAAVLGFSRARGFGASARWFAISAACMLLYHLQWVVFFIFGINQQDVEKLLGFGSFLNLFVLLGAISSIIGFVKLSDPRV